MIRQILYHSVSTVPGDGADLAGILQQSRHNNAIDGITGLLWSDGARFLQIFEGPEASIAPTWRRIQDDPRHRDLKLMHDICIAKPEFGFWTMAHRRAGEKADIYDTQMRRLLASVSPTVSRPFLDMISGDLHA